MCTRVIWPDANGAVVVGRNMDFHKDLMTNLPTKEEVEALTLSEFIN